MKITEFGKFLRKLRIEKDELLKDMAENLGVTASYLSAVEIGKRKIPKEWEFKIVNAYNLDENQASNLNRSILDSREIINIEAKNLDFEEKNLILMLARKVRDLNENEKKDLKELLFK